MTITEFLEARIAEDERHIARLAESDRRPVLSLSATVNHPQRLLAECAAKRAILKEHEIDLGMREPYCDTCAEWWNCVLGEGPPMVKYPCPTISALAAIYADHPDYDPDWA